MWRPLLQAVVACIWCYPMWGQLDPVGNLSLTNPPPEGFHHSQLTRHRAAQSDLWTLCRELQSQKFVDLTHAFDSASPHWPGFSTMSTLVPSVFTPQRGMYDDTRREIWSRLALSASLSSPCRV